MVICGAIFTSHVIVQRLTDYMWIGDGRVIDDGYIIRIARVLGALSSAVSDLEKYYNSEVKLSNELEISRFFSLATSYTKKERSCVKFRYVRPLKDDDTSCIVFLAQEEDGREIVVKFVEQYGVAAHMLLAEHNLAPELLYYGDVWPSEELQEGCGHRRMVVMEYIGGQSLYYYKAHEGEVPAALRDAVERAVRILHEQKLVHGDIRTPNIIVEGDEERWGVKIIDFDWAGKAGEARYPATLSSAVKWADGVQEYGLIEASHDLFKVEEL